MAKFGLLTDEYDGMAGSFSNPHETIIRSLSALTFDEAIVEAKTLFDSLDRYVGDRRYNSNKKYPCNPRLVYQL